MIATGCWTGTPAAPRSTSCEIHELLVTTAGTAQLGLHGRSFARIDDPLVRLDVVVRGAVAHARIESELVDLEGELALDELPLRPNRIALHDGWLEVRHAIGRAAYDSALRLEVPLPGGLQPAWTSLDVPCDQLTFARAAPVTFEPDRVLPAGTSTMLYRVPNAQPIGTWTATPRASDPAFAEESLEAQVLERRGDFVRIRIEGRNAVLAWVRASALVERPDETYGSLFGTEIGDTVSRMQCPDGAPLYVRIDGRVERVGRLKPNASVITGASRPDEIEVELGKTELRPFVRRREAAACVHRR